MVGPTKVRRFYNQKINDDFIEEYKMISTVTKRINLFSVIDS